MTKLNYYYKNVTDSVTPDNEELEVEAAGMRM